MTKRTSRTKNNKSEKYYYKKVYKNINDLRENIVDYFVNNETIDNNIVEQIKNENGYYHESFPSWAQERIDECILMCKILLKKNV